MSVPIQPLLIAAALNPHRWRLIRIAVRLLRHEQDASALLPTVLSAVSQDRTALLCAFTLFCRGGHEAAVTEYSKNAPEQLRQIAIASLAGEQSQPVAKMPAADDATLLLPLEDHEIAVARLLAGDEASVTMPTLIRLLDNPDAEIRAEAGRALRLRAAECRDELCALLPGLSVAAKGAVITVLAELQEERVGIFLCSQFENEPASATETTIRALGSYRTPRALEALMKVVLHGKHSDAALDAVAAFGASGAEAMLAAYRNEPRFRSSGAQVARVLQGEALSALCEALDDSRRVIRDSGEQGLAVLGEKAISELIPRLLDPAIPTDIHLRAIRLLSRVRQKDALDALLSVAEERTGIERAAIVAALSSYPGPQTVKVAQTATESTDARVRAAGQRTLKKMALPPPSEESESFPLRLETRASPHLQQAAEARSAAHPIDGWINSHFSLHDVTWRPGPVPKADPAINTEVHFSVTAPERIARQQTFILDVWAHAERQTPILRLRPPLNHEHLRRVVETVGPVFIDKGVRLEVTLSIPEFSFADENSLSWSGAPGNCNFAITVPDDVKHGAHGGVITVRLGSIRVARVSFVLEVGDQPVATIADVTGFDTRAERWFASYASVDRGAVLGRIQGMQKVLPELDIFVDVAALRSGERWQARIDEEITARDGLYLFWSPAAMRSIHVDYEWRTAYRLKGLDGINPIPLAAPNIAPPPEELRSLHFNEWTLSL